MKKLCRAWSYANTAGSFCEVQRYQEDEVGPSAAGLWKPRHGILKFELMTAGPIF